MGLEKLVNAILKPVEKLAGIVYDTVFATSKIDDKGVTTNKYSGGYAQRFFGAIGGAYKSLKEVIMNYSVKPVDKFVDYSYAKMDKYFLQPLSKTYEAHPIITTLVLSYFALSML